MYQLCSLIWAESCPRLRGQSLIYLPAHAGDKKNRNAKSCSSTFLSLVEIHHTLDLDPNWGIIVPGFRGVRGTRRRRGHKSLKIGEVEGKGLGIPGFLACRCWLIPRFVHGILIAMLLYDWIDLLSITKPRRSSFNRTTTRYFPKSRHLRCHLIVYPVTRSAPFLTASLTRTPSTPIHPSSVMLSTKSHA